MIDRIPDTAPAFRRLRRTLLLRRLRRLDPVLRLELALIGALVAAYVAWQTRLPLDRLARTAGADAVTGALAASLFACAVMGGSLAGGDHARRFHSRPNGPEWPALPLAPAIVAGQSAWESSLHALWILPLALGVLAAGVDLMPWWRSALLAVAFVLILPAAGRSGAWLARWVMRRRLAPAATAREAHHRFAAPWDRVRTGARARVPAARWSPGATRALFLKDLARSLRRTPARPPAAAWGALLSLAVGVWALPVEDAAAGALSSALALLAAVMLADWMIALSAGEPYPLLASLPVSARRVWIQRVGIATVATAVTALLLAGAAHRFEPAARFHLVVSLALSTLLIAVLGVTYGLTLFPRVETARRLLLLWLVLALVASILFPLAGWVVLLGALLHSLRRLRARSTLAADVTAEEA